MCCALLRDHRTTIQEHKLLFNQHYDVHTTQRAQIPPNLTAQAFKPSRLIAMSAARSFVLKYRSQMQLQV